MKMRKFLVMSLSLVMVLAMSMAFVLSGVANVMAATNVTADANDALKNYKFTTNYTPTLSATPGELNFGVGFELIYDDDVTDMTNTKINTVVDAMFRGDISGSVIYGEDGYFGANVSRNELYLYPVNPAGEGSLISFTAQYTGWHTFTFEADYWGNWEDGANVQFFRNDYTSGEALPVVSSDDIEAAHDEAKFPEGNGRIIWPNQSHPTAVGTWTKVSVSVKLLAGDTIYALFSYDNENASSGNEIMTIRNINVSTANYVNDNGENKTCGLTRYDYAAPEAGGAYPDNLTPENYNNFTTGYSISTDAPHAAVATFKPLALKSGTGNGDDWLGMGDGFATEDGTVLVGRYHPWSGNPGKDTTQIQITAGNIPNVGRAMLLIKFTAPKTGTYEFSAVFDAWCASAGIDCGFFANDGSWRYAPKSLEGASKYSTTCTWDIEKGTDVYFYMIYTLDYNALSATLTQLYAKYLGGESHDNVNVWADTTEHWASCAECGLDSVKVAHTDSNGDAKCDECGGDVCQHTGATTWAHDDNQHWKVCSGCGQQIPTSIANHNPVGADCKTVGTCECGQTGAKNPSVHAGTTALVKNNNGTHTEKYGCCGAEVKTENCTYDTTTYKCACGNECPHTAYANGKCTVCTKAHENHTGGEATCNSKAVCETCGIEYGTKDANNHKNDNKTIFEQVAGTNTHKQKCSACNVVYGNAVDCAGGTATCSAKATCTKCGKTYGDLDANNHDVTGVDFVSLGDGTHAKECKLCHNNVDIANCNDGQNGNTADCENKAVCVTCNTAYGEVNSTKHVCGEAPVWEKVDEQTHANKWPCGVVVDTKNHNDDKAEATCNAKAQCSVCGSEWGEYNEDNHEEEIEYTTNNDGTHVAKYPCCDAVDTTDTNCDGEATCSSLAKCSKCGGEYGAVDPDNHAGNCVVVLDETLTDDFDHYFVYSECGAAANDGAHEYDVTGLCVCGYTCTHSVDSEGDGFCDACGANVDHVHDWSNGVCQDALCGVECPHTAYNGYNNGVDSYKCKVCDVVCDHANDNGENKATCVTKAECSVCKQTYGEYDATNHASNEFDHIVIDETGHKKVNLCCGATVVESEAHTFGDDSKCDDCGFTCTEHDYLDGTCVICAQDHTKHTGATCTNGGACTVCQKVYTTVEHTNRSNATCTAKAVCVYCGEYGEYDYTKHTSDKVKYDVTKDTHTELHACCGTATGKAAEAHKGGNATCKELAACEVCGEKYGDFSGHTGGAATCTEKAVCTVCGEAYGEDTDGHTGGKATCCKKAVCTVCGEEYGALDAANHEKGVKWTITADKHSSKYECCGAVATAEAAHTGGKATCEEKAKCSVCGASYGELDPTNHASKTYTWKKDSKVHSATYDCCGAVAVAEEAHDPKNCDKCGGYSAPTSDVAISIAAAIAVTGIIGFAVATKKRKH